MSRVLVVGSSNFDLVWRTAKLPGRGETVSSTGFATFCGGKGANQAVACAKAGAETWFCGCVGEDSFAQQMRESMCAAGVQLGALRSSPKPSGTASVVVEEGTGANQIVVDLGANGDVTADQVRQALEELSPDIVLVQLEIPLEAAMAASETSGIFILNPAPAMALPESLLGRCDFLIPNEHELQIVAPGAARENSVRSLLALGVKNVVTTLGEAGAAWSTLEGETPIPSFPVTPVDTVGAGDAFCGAFAARLAGGHAIEDSLRFASAAAALSVTKHGAQASAPTLDEVASLLA